MKSRLLYTIAAFLFVTIFFTVGFIYQFSHGAKIGIATLKNIVIDRALCLSIPISIAYFAIHSVVITQKNRWVLAIMILLILGTLYAVLGYFFLFHIVLVGLLDNPFVD
ncbi:hypothetical protein [Sphingobacterium chungjuense]|uniref:hypothetical protein n=1 Tax=Sphingobacterium chungjuense TaxID=2675553 RepID=UPI00140AA1B0|nr:hypothetical protein [Sphingobacterium chungjuense]